MGVNKNILKREAWRDRSRWDPSNTNPIRTLKRYHHHCCYHYSYLMSIVFCLHVCLCTMFMAGACGGQKRPVRVLDHKELELQTIVSYHAGSGNWTWVFCKNNCWALSPALIFTCYKLGFFVHYVLWWLFYTNVHINPTLILQFYIKWEIICFKWSI